MGKPRIIVLSRDDSDTFTWLSDGWNQAHQQDTPRARQLMARARQCIDVATDVPDAINRLQQAGFAIRRENPGN